MNTVSVIIVNWNGKKFLQECLESLKNQIYKPSSIILVDNGSNDGSIDLVSRYHPDVKVIALHENKGFSTANNIALRTVQTEYVALLNNDAVAHPLWLQALLEGLDAHPEAGFAASKMLYHDTPKVMDRAGDAYTRAGTAFLRGRGMTADAYSNPEWIFGACAGAALYRMSMFMDTGLFDEDFFLLYEDVDLSFRAQLKGYKCLYVSGAVVYHKVSGSIVQDSPTSVYYSHRNLEWVYIQNMPFRLIIKSIIPHLIYDLAAFVYFVIHGRGKDFIRAKKNALKGISRVLQKRRLVQGSRVVNDTYVWSLFDKEKIFRRLSRRIQKS